MTTMLLKLFIGKDYLVWFFSPPPLSFQLYTYMFVFILINDSHQTRETLTRLSALDVDFSKKSKEQILDHWERTKEVDLDEDDENRQVIIIIIIIILYL